MTRLTALCVFFLSATAFAQAPEPAKPGKPAEPAAPPQASEGIAKGVEREQLRREVMDEVKRALEKQKAEVRDEVRAQVATQTATRSLEEDFQIREQRKKLELFEVDGYFRVRPELFYQLDLRRGADPAGHYLFPVPLRDSSGKTLADANMRWRLEPTLNISEDIRLHAQLDMLDNIIMGSTPEVGDDRVLFVVGSPTQLTPTAVKNALVNSVQLKRAYGEVNTPIGQFFFGRMGSHWGLGMLANSGNCLDCDYGDTVDRFMFVAKLGDFFIVPMIDFVSEGPLTATSASLFGTSIDSEQSDDARAYSIAIARRDSDAEIARKLQARQRVINYGLYFTYRHQNYDYVTYSATDTEADKTLTGSKFVPRGANLYIPDLWFKFQTPKLRIEAEVAGVFGKINNALFVDNVPAQALTVSQVGAVVQGEYKLLDALSFNLEVGFASGDRSAGMGNEPGINGQVASAAGTAPGGIDGPQFCVASSCQFRDTRITNFRFSRDYRVDLILWRELFNGVTDALYLRPGAKYELTEGFSIWANVIYSRAIYGESTPSSHLVGNSLVGDPNLGVEIDGGVRYESGDGFQASLAYGALFPLAGLSNNISNPTIGAQTAQTLRAWFTLKY